MKSATTSSRQALNMLHSPKLTPQDLKRLQRREIYSDPFITVEWLNAVKDKAAYERVVAVRKELEELGAMLNSLRQLEQARKQWIRNQKPIEEILEIARNLSPAEKIEADEAIKAKQKLRAQFRERHDAFNQTIAPYTFAPALEYNLDTGFWRLGTLSLRGPAIRIACEDGPLRIDEGAVVAALARLAANGELNRVRLCEQCQNRWIVSLRTIDKFCTADCRKRFHANSEDYKRKHRDAQKKYRKGEAARDAQAKRLAKGERLK